MTEIKKKYTISFITNKVVVKADDEHMAVAKAIEVQIHNNLPIEIIKVQRGTYLSTASVFTNY